MALRLRSCIPWALDTGWLQVMNTSAQLDPQLQQAFLLVGQFQYHFAQIEQKIDQGVIKILDLDDKAGPIVTGSVDFAKKLNLLWAAANQQATTLQGREFVDNTCKAVLGVNTDRQLVIHSSFEPAPTGGVQFKRTVARDGRVRVDNQLWGKKKFDDEYTNMNKLAGDLEKLIDVVNPVLGEGFIHWVRLGGDPLYF
jgi:hypothetical protein